MAKHALVEQSTPSPTRKITAAGLGGLVASVVLGLADLGDVVDLPTFVDTLLGGLAAFAAGYAAKERAVVGR